MTKPDRGGDNTEEKQPVRDDMDGVRDDMDGVRDESVDDGDIPDEGADEPPPPPIKTKAGQTRHRRAVSREQQFGAWLSKKMLKALDEGHGGLTLHNILASGSAYMDCSTSQIRNYLMMLTECDDPTYRWTRIKTRNRVLVLAD